MGSYVTIYRVKPEQMKVLSKKWMVLAMGTGPKELKAAMEKIKKLQLFYAPSNGCIVGIYEIEDKDLVEANLITVYLADVCEMETFPVLNMEDYGKTVESFLKLFPDYLK